ncbi:ECF transporter S component [Romboutsia weinsteinii]|uniref:Riboflavin transporter n=1 Tax=Romboutsia weinsteinii TaxID=2020949 RepID=A0A371IXU8_9FIRM|nr:ECF transporter S component [Romboutsia weinsteinii]RDY25291.1 ECF transporter S component [Romboutsia weinsteinii]
MQGTVKNKKTISTQVLVKVAILSAIAYILMFISMPIPGVFPDFLKIDISDIPGIFGGMALGPVAGFVIIAIKNCLQAITASFTGGIGELANTIIGGTYVFILCYSYKKRSDIKGVLVGFLLGTIGMTIMGAVMNYFVMMPLYGKMMGLDAIIGMGSAINPKINDLLSFVIWMIVPFNIIKAIIMSLVTLPLYKKMGKLIKK